MQYHFIPINTIQEPWAVHGKPDADAWSRHMASRRPEGDERCRQVKIFHVWIVFIYTTSGLQSMKDSVTLTVLTVTETRRRWERWKKKCFVFRQNSKNPYCCEFALLTARCSLRWLEKTSSSPGESLRERLPKRHWPNYSGTKWWFLSWGCCHLFNCFDCLLAAFNILTQFLSNLGQLLSDLASVL